MQLIFLSDQLGAKKICHFQTQYTVSTFTLEPILLLVLLVLWQPLQSYFPARCSGNILQNILSLPNVSRLVTAAVFPKLKKQTKCTASFLQPRIIKHQNWTCIMYDRHLINDYGVYQMNQDYKIIEMVSQQRIGVKSSHFLNLFERIFLVWNRFRL